MTCVAFSVAAADGPVVHERSIAPASTRYEIVQSPILARRIFKLDKVTGHVWTLVVDVGDERKWEPMAVIGLQPASATAGPHFQIFMSAILAKHAFLLDTSTGATWILTVVDDKAESALWLPVETLKPAK